MESLAAGSWSGDVDIKKSFVKLINAEPSDVRHGNGLIGLSS